MRRSSSSRSTTHSPSEASARPLVLVERAWLLDEDAQRPDHDALRGGQLVNPLTAVSMALRLAREQVQGGEDATLPWLLDRAVGGVDRMHGLIDDLLAFARLGGRLNRVPVALADLVDDVREDLATVLTSASVDVGPLPKVVGDPAQLRAVLQNLVANAAKFTRPGEPARIAVTAERREPGWRVHVIDHGIGVPPHERRRVFEPLARVDDGAPGSGIGLATVRRVVESHGGTVGLTETPGGGTTVWFDLPG